MERAPTSHEELVWPGYGELMSAAEKTAAHFGGPSYRQGQNDSAEGVYTFREAGSSSFTRLHLEVERQRQEPADAIDDIEYRLTSIFAEEIRYDGLPASVLEKAIELEEQTMLPQEPAEFHCLRIVRLVAEFNVAGDFECEQTAYFEVNNAELVVHDEHAYLYDSEMGLSEYDETRGDDDMPEDDSSDDETDMADELFDDLTLELKEESQLVDVRRVIRLLAALRSQQL